MPGSFVASGRAGIALHQIQELMAVPGIEIVGPLPGNLGAFLFSALTLIKSKGMEPAGR